mgnify:CR=1 FL=1
MTEDKNKVHVNEDKFNGTATLTVEAPTKEQARVAAKKYWKEEYGTNPSKICVDEREFIVGEKQFAVMVSDHSSGSLKSPKDYEITHPDDV